MLIIRSFVVAVGVIGFIMNGFVLRAVLSKKLKKNTSHTFLTNQVIMDTLSSFLLIVVMLSRLQLQTITTKDQVAMLYAFFSIAMSWFLQFKLDP